MNLFELDESYNVVVMPQALLLKPFAALYKRDRTDKKTRAAREVAFVYFYCDIKSDYLAFVEKEERQQSIMADLQLPKTWKIDKQVQAAIDFYEDRSKSVAAKLLDDSIFVASKLSSKMKEAVSAEGLALRDIEKLLSSLSKMPVVVKALNEQEQVVLKEIEAKKGSVGNKEKALFEDGI